jgi:hypothetical protein
MDWIKAEDDFLRDLIPPPKQKICCCGCGQSIENVEVYAAIGDKYLLPGHGDIFALMTGGNKQ